MGRLADAAERLRPPWNRPPIRILMADKLTPFRRPGDFQQLLARLASAFDELPSHLRAVFTLCDLEGIRGVEVARILDVPEGTVWRRLHDARARLRDRIDRKGPR